MSELNAHSLNVVLPYLEYFICASPFVFNCIISNMKVHESFLYRNAATLPSLNMEYVFHLSLKQKKQLSCSANMSELCGFLRLCLRCSLWLS